jgi:MFS family permease
VAGAVAYVCNGSSRIFWASMMDCFGWTKVYMVLLCVQLIVAIVIGYVRSSPVPYIICVGLSLLTEGGHLGLFPAACGKIFGIKYGGLIYSFMFFALAFSSLFGFLLVQLGGKDPSFARIILGVATGFTVVNIILMLFFDDSEIKLDEHGQHIKTENSLYFSFIKRFRRPADTH